MMNADTEKALLDGFASMCHWIIRGEVRYPFSRDQARAYLATLEPKPEPKRGVEELIGMASELYKTGFATISDSRGTRSVGPLLEEALRVYREERERVERAIATLRAHGSLSGAAVADELERSDG